MRYPPEVVAAKLVHTGAQQHLIEKGLPHRHVLFDILPPVEVALRTLVDGTEVLVIGSDRGALDVCIGVLTGKVIEVNRPDQSVWLVNSTVQKFAQCLDEFSRRYPFGESSNDLDTAEAGR